MNEQSVMLKPVGDLLKSAWDKFTKHFNVWAPIMLVAGIGLYLEAILLLMNPGQRGYITGPEGILGLLATIVYIVAIVWGFSALYLRVMKFDQPATLKQAYLTAKPYIWPMVVVGFLTGLFTMIGLLLLVIPGIIVAVWLSFSYYIVIDENKRGMDALKASKEYVSGYWWPVFGRLVVVVIALCVVNIAASTLLHALLGVNLGTIADSIFVFLITPFVVLYQYELYKNLKQVKGAAVPQVAAEPAPASDSPAQA